MVQKIFNQVLLPLVAADLRPEAVEKAAAFASQMQCHLHVMVVMDQPAHNWNPFQFFHASSQRSIENITAELKQLEELYQPKMSAGLKLITSFRQNNLVPAIRSYCEIYNIDLVIFCNEIAPVTAGRELKNSGDLSSYINCPVLFSASLPSLSDLKIIVLPVDELLPVNKIRIAIYLAGKFNAVIHLLAMQSKKINYGDLDYLKRAYAVLKENTNQPFVCQTVQNKDLGKAAVAYARTVQAGLVVSRPVKQKVFFSPLKPFFKSLFSKKIEVPVMAVN